MEKVKQNKVAVRFNISEQANEKLELYQASERMKGNKLTKEEVADHMIINFKSKK